MNRTPKISTAAIVALTFLAYQFGKDVFKMGIKDGKATKIAMAKK